jgi:hypothetical protein
MTDFYITQKTEHEHWYQEPWMLVVVGGPLIVVIAALFTFYIAWQGEDNVLTKDYYKQGININKDIQRDAKAVEYQLQAQAKFEAASSKVQLQLEGKVALPSSLQMTISSSAHATEYEAIQKVTLNEVKPGMYEGTIRIPTSTGTGNVKVWHVKIEAADWRLLSVWHNPLQSQLQLKP